MEAWVERALARWPNVPALFGWLALDRRGRWLLRGEVVTRPQLIDTINRNYAGDEHGRWFFQNGPQRGYVKLAYAPLVLLLGDDGETLHTHTGLPVREISEVYLDEEGSLLLRCEHGVALLSDADLTWALARLQQAQHSVGEAELVVALQQPSGSWSALQLQLPDRRLPVQRLDAAQMPLRFGYVREPQAQGGEENECRPLN